jgi:hypothetical protein
VVSYSFDENIPTRVGAMHRPRRTHRGAILAASTYVIQESVMRIETVSAPGRFESPPLAPHDPPEPAPQAAAWRRALKVIGCASPVRQVRVAKTTARRVKWG